VSHYLFTLALAQARRESTKVETATSHPDELDPSSTYYLTDDLLSGFGVTTDGTLVALFSLVPGRGTDLLAQSVNKGACTLDCFDGFLPTYYARHGWVETSRIANWTEGEPDVVFMARV
jgi:hypothetical protein